MTKLYIESERRLADLLYLDLETPQSVKDRWVETFGPMRSERNFQELIKNFEVDIIYQEYGVMAIAPSEWRHFEHYERHQSKEDAARYAAINAVIAKLEAENCDSIENASDGQIDS